MKVVLFSDLHLDASFAWLGGDQQAARKRRQGLRDTLLRIVALVEETGAEALLCGGDLYEQDRFSPDTAEFLRSTLDRLCPVRVFIAPGNHDWYGHESLYQQVEWSPNVHVFTESRLEPVTIVDGLTLWGAAHRAPVTTDRFLDGFTVDRDGVNVALFHGSEEGWLTAQESGKVPHAPFTAEQIERACLDHAFLGHYHCPKDARRHTYPGNPHPLRFGEDGQRGAVIVSIAADGSVERERRTVANSDVHDIDLDVAGCTSQQDVRRLLAERLAGRIGVARVTLRGELGAEVDLRPRDLSDAAPWLDGLQVQVRQLYHAYDFQAISEEPTIRGQFVLDVMADSALSEEERRKVLVTGLRALDGRDDLEVP